jgi:hypothetical protein
MIQFAVVGLVSIGHTGDLQMPDVAARQVAAQLGRHVALDDLAVVPVHQDLELGCGDLLDDLVGVVLPVEQIARDVAPLIGSISRSMPTDAASRAAQARLST